MQSYSKKNNFYFNQKYLKENKSILLAALVLFILPLFPLNQLIVGIIVNAILIKFAISIQSKKIYFLSIIPSLAVFLGGILFANITPQIALMLPFIWISNFVLMFLTKKLFVGRKKNYFVSTLISSIAKTLVLFTFAFVLFYFSLVTSLFLFMFGIMQLITAESGAVLIYFLERVSKKVF